MKEFIKAIKDDFIIHCNYIGLDWYTFFLISIFVLCVLFGNSIYTKIIQYIASIVMVCILVFKFKKNKKNRDNGNDKN